MASMCDSGAPALGRRSILFPTASHPDASNILAVYFRVPAFNYYKNAVLKAGMDAGDIWNANWVWR